jgi:hypothetical protein
MVYVNNQWVHLLDHEEREYFKALPKFRGAKLAFILARRSHRERRLAYSQSLKEAWLR